MDTRSAERSVVRPAGAPEGASAHQDDLTRSGRAHPHLTAALAALALVAALLAASLVYSHWLERRYIHAIAPLLLTQVNLGGALQIEALRQPDLLPVYGSSELIDLPCPQRAFQFFQSYPTGFTVFTIAKAGATSLDMAQDLAALGSDLRGKKVVVSFTPSMFNHNRVSAEAYAADFSRLHAAELAFSHSLSFDLKQRFARRMLEYPKTLASDPLLRFALQQLVAGTPISRILYDAAWPLGQVDIWVIRIQDHAETVYAIWKQPQLVPNIRHKAAAIDWEAARQKAEQDQIANSSTNPYGIENSKWNEYRRKIPKNVAPGSSDTEFLQTMQFSQEWTDLGLLLDTLKELGAQPLIMSRPMNGPLWDAYGVSASARQVYYNRLEQTVAPYGFPLVDYREHDLETYFSIDAASHTSREGWVYVDQTLDSFYHGALH